MSDPQADKNKKWFSWGRRDKDEETPTAKAGLWRRLSQGLGRSSAALTQGIGSIFTKRKLDAATLGELEELLVGADFGVATAARLTARLAEGRYDKEIAPDDVRAVLAEEIVKILAPTERPLAVDAAHRPYVILVVGVNGTGKTTTIGKLAHHFRAQGLNVMLAAGDTFRAAAIDQLRLWGERTGTRVIAGESGADAAGLVFEACETARQDGADVLLVDTAGRLQNKAHLMAELEKILRVMRKLDASAPHAVVLVLDATTGQNALSQVEAFKNSAALTGLIMTKLDGTAKGGILVALSERFGLPIHAIGVGEGVEDLQPFDARAFADALTGRPPPVG